jgi:hypothetical protein
MLTCVRGSMISTPSPCMMTQAYGVGVRMLLAAGVSEMQMFF